MQGDPKDNDLSPEEWAELERLTAPEADEAGEVAESITPTPAQPPSDDATAVVTSEPREPREPSEPSAASDSPAPAPDWGAIAAAATPTPVPDEPGEPGQTASPQPVPSASGVEELSPPAATPVAEEASTTTDLDDEPGDTAASPVDAAAGSQQPVERSGDAEAAEVDAEVDAADAPATMAPKMALPRVIAVANQKGGVGKTTTTVNLAACLAEQGYRTLLVDLDPQANASTGVGIDSRQLEHSIYDVMLHDQPADSVIEPTEVKNLFVLPSSLDLAGAEIELVSLLSREHRLRLAIESVLDDFDYVLIDCPPSLGLLTINALTAAREVLVPIQCEYYALEGLGQLMRNVELVRASLNPTLQISHIVLVMFDPRTKLAGQVVDEVRTHFGAMVCQNVIPRTVRLSEAPSFGQPITTFDSGSRGAAAYRAVTQEVLDGQA